MLIHIPHSSIKLTDDVTVPLSDLYSVTDWYTDELFFWSGAEKAIFPWSRLVCDVERLVNDPLDAYGLGMHTTRTISGETYRSDYDGVEETYRLYRTWHADLAKKVLDQGHYTDRVVLIDAHSFSEKQILNGSNVIYAMPDICIGSNPETPKKLVNLSIDNFSKLGYSVSENVPYSGALRVAGAESVMIEINKRVYLTDDFRRNENFNKLKTDIETVLSYIGEYEIEGKAERLQVNAS